MTDYPVTTEATVARWKFDALRAQMDQAEALMRALVVIAGRPLYAYGHRLRQCCDTEDGQPSRCGCPVGAALRWLG